MGDLGSKLPLILAGLAVAGCSSSTGDFGSPSAADMGQWPGATPDAGTGAFNDSTCGSSLMVVSVNDTVPTTINAQLATAGGVAADGSGYHWTVYRAGRAAPLLNSLHSPAKAVTVSASDGGA